MHDFTVRKMVLVTCNIYLRRHSNPHWREGLRYQREIRLHALLNLQAKHELPRTSQYKGKAIVCNIEMQVRLLIDLRK
jgi:hypothetical protein